MNRKQRRAQASRDRKTLTPWVKEQIERINQQHREEVAYNQQQAEQALWTFLANLGIKEASGRWWYNPRTRNPTSEIYLSPRQYSSLRSMYSSKLSK